MKEIVTEIQITQGSSVHETKDVTEDHNFKRQLSPFKDILGLHITSIYFAKCPLRNWFFDHWALVFERSDGKYLTMQFLTLGLEI